MPTATVVPISAKSYIEGAASSWQRQYYGVGGREDFNLIEAGGGAVAGYKAGGAAGFYIGCGVAGVFTAGAGCLFGAEIGYMAGSVAGGVIGFFVGGYDLRGNDASNALPDDYHLPRPR